jgi:catechol 2,3-dioxygenase-like lactoylglutathione lyase family enzyme
MAVPASTAYRRQTKEDAMTSYKDSATAAGARPQPLIAARDVPQSSRWYAELLGAERSSVQWASDHSHLYDRIVYGERIVLQLHAWDEEDHPNLRHPDAAPVGHGVVLWFELDDFDAAVSRARGLGAKVVREPHVNPAPQHREIWLHDPDGYTVVICSPDGEAK